jgi:hypothetical protein
VKSSSAGPSRNIRFIRRSIKAPIYFMHYNFVRIHQTLKITPAMAASVTDKLWEMSDMVKVLEEWEKTQ